MTMAEMMYGSKPVTPVKRYVIFLATHVSIRLVFNHFRKLGGVPTSSCMASPKNSPVAKKIKKVSKINHH